MNNTNISASALVNMINSYSNVLPHEQCEEMKRLVLAGEYGVALENLCSQLYEFDASVPMHSIKQIEAMVTAMQLDDKYWKRLLGSNGVIGFNAEMGQ